MKYILRRKHDKHDKSTILLQEPERQDPQGHSGPKDFSINEKGEVPSYQYPQAHQMDSRDHKVVLREGNQKSLDSVIP